MVARSTGSARAEGGEGSREVAKGAKGGGGGAQCTVPESDREGSVSTRCGLERCKVGSHKGHKGHEGAKGPGLVLMPIAGAGLPNLGLPSEAGHLK